jgi:TolB protein
MKPILILTISLLAGGLALPGLTVAQEGEDGSTGRELHEVIVSHTDENGILQLYRMKEDGSAPTQLTHSQLGCRMPACSPDGRKLVYVQQIDHGLSVWLSDLDGKNAKALIENGSNLVPSWLPDSKHIVWMNAQPGQDPSRNSKIHLMNTKTGESRRLFTDPEQLKFSNSMPVVSPQGDRIAFVSNRSGDMRIWVSDLDGSNAKLISPPEVEYNEAIQAPIEQKVPAWSPDGKWIAHWEGVEMVHLSKFTGVANPERDRMISATFHVWVVGSDGKNRRKVGRGDDPTWSPDGFVTRAFPDPQRGGPKVMIETESGEKELPIVPHGRNWGRFAWLPQEATSPVSEQRGGARARNPILPAADPHAVLLDGVVYVYPTCGHPRKRVGGGNRRTQQGKTFRIPHPGL